MVTAAVIFAVVWSSVQRADWSAVILSVGILFVTTYTLTVVAPRPAEFFVERQHELGIDDLIFFVYPQPAKADEQQIPRDFLLQLHVAVGNAGNRKGVLSRLVLRALLDADGRPVTLPDVPLPLPAVRTSVRRLPTSGWQIEVEQTYPPFILEADDVLTLQFRARRGIDWSQSWDLANLRAFANDLERPIKSAKVEIVYRRGQELVKEDRIVEVAVQQQELYASLLRSLTLDFAKRPNIAVEPIQLE